MTRPGIAISVLEEADGRAIRMGRENQIMELVAQVDEKVATFKKTTAPFATADDSAREVLLLERLKAKILVLSMNLDFCVEDIREARATNKTIENQLRRERAERRNLADQLSAYMRAAGEEVPR